METSFHFGDELLCASTENERACFRRGAALKEVETLAADLTLFELFTCAEVLGLDVGAGGGDAAACGLDDAFEVVGGDTASTEDVTICEVSRDGVSRLASGV